MFEFTECDTCRRKPGTPVLYDLECVEEEKLVMVRMFRKL